MRVFVTGASGFVGSAVVQELIRAGHEVLGLARSDKSAEQVAKAGAQVHRGNLDDLSSLEQGAANCDAVIHTGFNHDFSQFKANCEADRKIIAALAAPLAGTDRPLIITSGIGVVSNGRTITEDDVPPSADKMPRAATEEAARLAMTNGTNVYMLRLPPSTHGAGDHGFVYMLGDIAKQHGVSAYIGEGKNRWPAVHRFDAAVLYRLIAEQRPSQKVFHAVAEDGIEFRLIAEAIGRGLQLPTVSKPVEEAEKHFTWFKHFASFDCPASVVKTKQALPWEAKEIGLLEDVAGNYF